MNDEAQTPPGVAGGEIRFLDVLAVLLRRWKTIAVVTLAALVAAIPLALLQRNEYIARVVVVPVTEQGSGRGGAMPGLPPAVAAMMGGIAPPSNQRLVTDVLKSRALAEHVAARLEPESPQEQAEVARWIGRELRLERAADGTAVSLQVRADDAQRAAAIANQIVPSANAIVSRLSADAAMRRREYLLSQLEGAREHLTLSEQRLLEFQRSNNLPEVALQTERTVEAAAQLQQMVVQQELVVAQLRRTATAENPQLQAAIAELNTRRAQLRRITAGERGGNQLFLPMSESPELKAQATRLLRDYTRDEQVYIALAAALSEAELGVKNDMPVLTILDEARVPTAPLSRTGTVMAVAGILGLLMGLAAAFLGEFAGKGRTTERNRSFYEAWDGFRADMGRLLRGRRRTRVPAPH